VHVFLYFSGGMAFLVWVVNIDAVTDGYLAPVFNWSLYALGESSARREASEAVAESDNCSNTEGAESFDVDSLLEAH